MMNKKGELRIGMIIIAFATFMVFLTAGLIVVDDFMSVPQYGSDFNRSYYSTLDNNRMDTNSTGQQGITGLIYGTNDLMMESNSSASGTATTDEQMNRKSLESILSFKNIYILFKNLRNDLSDKLHIPMMFFDLILLIIVVTVTIAGISALRGIGNL